MPRIVKRPEDRRNELLDCAQALFFERGYEQTTVTDVTTRANVSKGTLYHYFASKEEMLEALAARLASESVSRLHAVLEDSSLGALSRLNAVLSQARRMKVESAPSIRAMFDTVFRPENVVLYHRLHAAVMKVMTPVFERIIAQGVAEGLFDTPNPRATAEIVLQLGASTHDAVASALEAASTAEANLAADQLDERLRLQGIAIDRILGLPDGSIEYVEPGFGRAIMLLQ